MPEPTGVVAILAPAEPPLLGLVSRVLPALAGGNAVVAVASEAHPVAAVELAEALATSDFPGGVVNILTGSADELAPWLAGHMDVNAIDLTGSNGQIAELERAAAENVKRVVALVAGCAEPVRDRGVPRAQDRLAPDRALAARRVNRLAKLSVERRESESPRDEWAAGTRSAPRCSRRASDRTSFGA